MKKASYVSAALFVAGAWSGCGNLETSSSGARGLGTEGTRLFLTGPVLQRLQERARGGDASWVALQKRCDQLAGGTMYPPSGNAYPNFPNVGAGYQGESYLPEIRNLGLCYRIVRGVDGAAEQRYAAAGAKLLAVISTPPASGGAQPKTDSGYGIRNYGVAMAVGFDWLYPALSASQRQQVIGTLNTWIDWYDASGFSRNQPIGNYFAGYLLAKGAAALATEDDNPKAAGYWNDIENRLWPQLVQPAYAKSMKGGGWPEGWGYGPKAVRNMVEFLWAARTAKGLDWDKQVPLARDEAAYINYFAWPSLRHMDDQGTVRAGTSIAPNLGLAATLSSILEESDDSYAAVARGYAADLKSAGAGGLEAWQQFMYWDDSLPRSSYAAQQLSYAASGPGHVAMRSSWQQDAVWGSLVGGAYINAPDSGEQGFNEGAIAIVQGDQPILVNAAGWIPQTGGTAGEDFVYNDTWSSRTRKLNNTFFVADSNNTYNPGQGSVSPDKAGTHVERYEDGGGFVRARAAQVEDMYIGRGGAPVAQFTRDLVYLRPGTFVVYDRTSIASAGADQWMAFHTPTAPQAVSTGDGTQRRYDIQGGSGRIGSLRTLLPRGAATQVASTVGSVSRIESHPAQRAADQDWLTVVTAGAAVPEQVRLSAADGNVQGGNMVGVHLLGARNQVVLLTADHAGEAMTSAVRYVVAQSADADHVLVDMAPSSSGYSVSVSRSGNGLLVDVRQGGSFHASATGSLSFTVGADGSVRATGWVAGSSSTGSTGGSTSGGSTGGGTSGGGSTGGGSTGGGSTGGGSTGGGSTGGGSTGGTGSTGTSTGTNLLQNASLESWSGGLPTGWLRRGGGTISESANVKDGGASAQVGSASWSNGLYQSVSFSSAVAAGKTLTASAWVRFVTGDGTAPLLQLVVDYADGAPTSYVNSGVQGWSTNGAWVQGQATVKAAHPVSRVALHVISNTGSAQVYAIDAASLSVN